jgi:hypothetical protein
MKIHSFQFVLLATLVFSFVIFERRLSEFTVSSSTLQEEVVDEMPSPVTNNLRQAVDTHQESPKVLYTVFAGRKDRLLLQEPYWREMIRIKAIDEVHLWNFTNNPGDLEYMRHVAKKYSSFLKIMEPTHVPLPETYWFDKNNSLSHAKASHLGRGRGRLDWPARRSYTEYYKYYSDNPYDGVIIKADDDIVWINTTQVKPFAEYLWNHRNVFLLSASVVNQGLCAYHQQQHGAIPKDYLNLPKPGNGMGDLHSNSAAALMLHRYFLQSEENRRKFFITEPEFYPFDYTINVNFVAIRGQDFPKAFELILEMLEREKRYYDEGAIAHDGIQKGYQEGIYMPLVVAHATYSHQVEVHREVLTAYHDYAKKEQSDFYGKILDEWEPPPEPKGR